MSIAPLGVLCLSAALLPLSPQTIPASGQLRWVRGVVITATQDAVTLKLKDKTVDVAVDAVTYGTGSAAVGSTIDVHYVDRNNVRRAVVITSAPDSAARLSKRPGRSYLGVVKETKRGRLSMRVDTRTRHVELSSKTALLDREGHTLGTGRKSIAAALAAGEQVLVTYDEESSDIPAGDVMLPSSSQRAVDIRLFR